MVEKTSVAFVYEQVNISHAKLIIKSGLKLNLYVPLLANPRDQERFEVEALGL